MPLGEYSGTTIQRLRIQNILLTENKFPPNLSIEEHSHAYPHFTIMLDGGFTETYDGQQFQCEKGSVLIVPEGQPHTDVIGPNGAHSLSIEISRSLVKFLSLESDLLSSPKVVNDLSLKPRTLALRKLFIQSPTASHFELHSAAMQVILGVFQSVKVEECTTKPRWLVMVIQELNRDSLELPTIQELARLAGVSPAHLSRTFRQATGQTILEFHRQNRLKIAAEKIIASSDSLAVIAADTGFCDQAHFTKSFKAEFGITPSDYRINNLEIQIIT